MTEEEAFIEAILESPNDVTHRLVYADWLDERSDPRAEYLRLQVALEASDVIDGNQQDRFWGLQSQLDRDWIALMNRGRSRKQKGPGKKPREGRKQRQSMEARVTVFVRKYGSRRGNDRDYDRKVEEQVKRMNPEDLDRLLRGEDD
jgi:uncharacterized protein (TIGR02996 family)